MGTLLLLAMMSAATGAGLEGSAKIMTAPDLERADDRACASAVQALRAQFQQVSDVLCRPSLYKTSYPARLLLTYTLDGRSYTEFVTVSSVRTGASRKPVDRPKSEPK